MNIYIIPTETTHVCNRIQISMDDFKLKATNGSCRVFFYNESGGSVVKVERIEIPEEVYTNWGTDDQVIVDYVLSTLQLQEGPEPEIEPITPVVIIDQVEPEVELNEENL